MDFILEPSKFFLKQLSSLNKETRLLIKKKLLLTKENPFRNKRIKGHDLFLFRIRFSDGRKEKRIIYLLDTPLIIILFILDRDKEYKDIKNYLKKINH